MITENSTQEECGFINRNDLTECYNEYVMLESIKRMGDVQFSIYSFQIF